MAIERKTKRLEHAGIAALLAGLAACSPMNEGEGEGEVAVNAGDEGGGYSAAAGEGEGEGEGEGSAASGGGEFGIDPAQAARNPVTYLTALEVMRAHYLAGIAAYEVDRRAVAAEMFTHPISEIYVDLEEVLLQLGAPEFGDLLSAAAAAPYDGSSDAEIRAAVAAVLIAIDEAETHAPASDHSNASIEAQLLVNMVMRAALQYEYAASTDIHNGPYLDGYGFTASARVISDRYLDDIRALDGEVADRLSAAMDALIAAYPTVLAPDILDADAEAIIQLAQAASTEVERLE